MNKLVSDGSVKKINYPVLYESGITPPGTVANSRW